jgi:hypothetical protein
MRDYHVTITYRDGLSGSITNYKGESKADVLRDIADRAERNKEDILSITIVKAERSRL